MSDVSPYHTLVTLLDFRNNCVFLQEEIKDGSVNLSVKSEIKAIKSFFFLTLSVFHNIFPSNGHTLLLLFGPIYYFKAQATDGSVGPSSVLI